MSATFQGSFVAMVTPFRNGQVDEAKVRELVEWHVSSGTDAIVPCGTTGEAVTMDAAERFQVVRRVVRQSRRRVPVIAGTGSNSTAATVTLTKDARRAGADAALVVTPYYNKPTQEGLYRHFRPEFLRALRQLADEHEALLIFDEIQTGLGLTGKLWAFQHVDVTPDLVVFGKKMQVCGVFAGPRVDEVPQNVFVEPSRLGSTWGGNLTDMVRATRYLEIIAEERLVENARDVGAHLLQRLQELAPAHPRLVSNVRGRGLLCALDLPTPEQREALRKALYAEGLLILQCGTHGLRFRPPLDITPAEIDEGIAILQRTLEAASL